MGAKDEGADGTGGAALAKGEAAAVGEAAATPADVGLTRSRGSPTQRTCQRSARAFQLAK